MRKRYARKRRDFRNETESLNRVPIQAVGNLLNLTLPPNKKVSCPFPDHLDKRPSFQVNGTTNRWVCFGCDRRGGAIDLVRYFLGMEFMDAKKWLAENLGNLPNTMVFRSNGTTNTGRFNPTAKNSKSNTESPPDNEVYHALLECSPLLGRGRKYLNDRGLTDKTIAAFRIGQVQNTNLVIDSLVSNYGHKRIKDAGLLTPRSSLRDPRMHFPKHSILFPFFEKNRIVYFQVRSIYNAATKSPWINLNYRKRRLYNSDALEVSSGKPLAICEGVLDALSAMELGYEAIGLASAHAKLTVDQLRLLRGREIIILLDWDKVGETQALRLQQEFRKFGVTAIRKACPLIGAKDVNDYLVAIRRKDGRS